MKIIREEALLPDGTVQIREYPQLTPRLEVPQEIRNRQARTMLRRAGLLDQLEAIINQPGNEEIRDAYEYELNFTRHSPFVVSMGQALGLSEKQIDDLFIEGAKIK